MAGCAPRVLFGLGARRLGAGASAVVFRVQAISTPLIGTTIARESPAAGHRAGSLAVVPTAAWIAGGPGLRLRPPAVLEVAS